MLRLAALLVRAFRRRAGVLLQLGRGGERGGAQDRTQGDRAHADRGARGRASTAARSAPSPPPASPGSGRASGRSSRGSPSRGRTTSSRSRQRVAPGGELAAILLEPVLGEGGVLPLEDGLRPGSGRARPRGRSTSLRRRGTGRARPHGDVLRLRAARHRAGSRDAREGPRQRPADRRAARSGSGSPTRSGRATTARRSAAIRSPPRLRAPSCEAIDDALLENVAARGAQLVGGSREALRRARGARARPAPGGPSRPRRVAGRRRVPRAEGSSC